MGRYVWRDLSRNLGRTTVSVLGVGVAVAFVAAIALFVDTSSARMTAQALRPVTVDLQLGVANPLAPSLVVEESPSPRGPFEGQQLVTVSITVRATAPASGIVVKDPGSDRLAYVPGTTKVAGTPIPDDAPPSAPDEPPAAPPASPLVAGVKIPTLAAGGTVTIAYQARVLATAPTDAALGLAAAATSAEDATPAGANAPPPSDVAGLAAAARGVAGVRAAEPFALVDLPAGALRMGAATPAGPIHLVAVDEPSYTAAFPLIRELAGAARPGAASLSRPAADATGAVPGDQVQLTIPGRAVPLTVPVGAVVDLTGADQLFASRNADTLGDPVAAPFVVVVDTATFRAQVLPGLRADAASKAPLAQPPFVEIHVALDRSVLGADPAKAAVRALGMRRTLERLAPGQLVAIDNVEAALTRASRDAILAKALFLLLALPGVLLAGGVARYAAALFAEGQRRERALLRARGFGPAWVRRTAAATTAVVAVLGAAVGAAAGAGGTAAFVSLGRLPTRSVVLSLLLAAATAAVTAAAAVYLPARRSLAAAVSDERRQRSADRPPRWLTSRADVALVGGAALVGVVMYLAGGFKVTAAATESQSVSLSFFFLLCPLLAWLGATLVVARTLLAAGGWAAARSRHAIRAGGLGRRLAWLSLLRRRRAAVSGASVMTLATAFTVAMAVFVATYHREQRLDARFIVGADVRLTLGPSAGAQADLEARLRVPGVAAVSAVATTPSAQVGNDKNLMFAAVDPARFAALGVLEPGFSSELSPAAALAALEKDPSAVLVDRETAKTFNLHRGDTLRVELPNAVSGRPVSITVRVAGTHIFFPGFPQGVDFVGNLATYRAATNAAPDAFGVRVEPGADPRAVGAAIEAHLGPSAPVRVDTTASALNREQSTLASLNLGALGRLDQGFGLALGGGGGVVLVFGMLLARRREHATLRAMGLGLGAVAGVVLGEAALVALVAVGVGAGLGVGLAALDVQILRPLFVIPPHGLHALAPAVATPAALVAVGVALALLGGLAELGRVDLVEILRED